jgi:hypothetical protein
MVEKVVCQDISKLGLDIQYIKYKTRSATKIAHLSSLSIQLFTNLSKIFIFHTYRAEAAV